MITRHRGEYPLTLMCRVLSVSRSGFYAWLDRKPSDRARTDARLKVIITANHRRCGSEYGARRHAEELLQKEKWPVFPDLLQRNFTVSGPNHVWASDITCCPTGEGWLFLAVVVDLFSRRIVGWAVSRSIDQRLVVTAWERAVALRQPGPGLIHHSDRGSVYASAAYRAALASRGAIGSMSRKETCWDNAVVESFFATLKRGLVDRRKWPLFHELESELKRYIEHWYNQERRHSTQGYLSPAEFEREQRHAA